MKKLFITIICSLFILPAFSQEEINIVHQPDTLDAPVVDTVALFIPPADISPTNYVDPVAIEQPSRDSHHLPFKHLGIGLRLGTYGFGIEASTTLTQHFKLRGRFSFASYSDGYSLEIIDPRIQEVLLGNFNPELRLDAKISFANAHLLVDIHPMNYGIFHFTTGVFIGNNKIDGFGALIDPRTGKPAQLKPEFKEWPDLILGGHDIGINDDGSVSSRFVLGNVVKPYFGIGLGRSLPKKRFGVMFELGVVYQGDFRVEQGQFVVNVNRTLNDSFSDAERYTRYFKWWPMLNLQLIYRIF